MKNNIIPLTIKIAEITYNRGIKHVVLSPGSRSAPLTIAFVRHPQIQTYIIPDERSAGYVALGMSLTLQEPVGLVSTSGTATINLFSPIAEAFYQNIPLIIFTADRPPEWIDQADGQTIHQANLYGEHVKKYFSFPSDQDFKNLNWYAERMINEALNCALDATPGPVHINVPVRDPFYPGTEEEYTYNTRPKIIEAIAAKSYLDDHSWGLLQDTWECADKILIVGGQARYNRAFTRALDQFTRDFHTPIVGDTIANIHDIKGNLITHHDLILSRQDPSIATLAPDLLITFGSAVVSKNLKLFLRKYPPSRHWHIQKAGYVPDTFQSLTTTVSMLPEDFLQQASKLFKGKNNQIQYLDDWKDREIRASAIIKDFFRQTTLSELEAVYQIVQHLPDNINLHLANSMPVRLLNLIGMLKPGIEVFSNRGISGIDGCTSTALGVSLHSKKLNVLITGDMAFFYDRNGLWHNYIPGNLRIIILNNHGGGIFRLIDGPSDLPELDEYFVTDQKLTARNSASDFGLEYFHSKDVKTLEDALHEFLENRGKAKILEIETDSQINKTIFDSYISQFN